MSRVGDTLIYSVNNEAIVAIDPSQPLPRWVFKEDGETIVGRMAINNQLLVTTPLGAVRLLDIADGERLVTTVPPDRQTVALTPAIAVRPGYALLLTANGTGRIVNFRE